jgi:hypothetical protein
MYGAGKNAQKRPFFERGCRQLPAESLLQRAFEN